MFQRSFRRHDLFLFIQVHLREPDDIFLIPVQQVFQELPLILRHRQEDFIFCPEHLRKLRDLFQPPVQFFRLICNDKQITGKHCLHMYDALAIPSPDPLSFYIEATLIEFMAGFPFDQQPHLLFFSCCHLYHIPHIVSVRRVCFATSQAIPVPPLFPVSLPNSLLPFLPAVLIPDSLNYRNNVICFLLSHSLHISQFLFQDLIPRHTDAEEDIFFPAEQVDLCEHISFPKPFPRDPVLIFPQDPVDMDQISLTVCLYHRQSHRLIQLRSADTFQELQILLLHRNNFHGIFSCSQVSQQCRVLSGLFQLFLQFFRMICLHEDISREHIFRIEEQMPLCPEEFLFLQDPPLFPEVPVHCAFHQFRCSCFFSRNRAHDIPFFHPYAPFISGLFTDPCFRFYL